MIIQQKKLRDFKELRPICDKLHIERLRLERMTYYEILIEKLNKTKDVEKMKYLSNNYVKNVKLIDYEIKKLL